MNRRQRRRIRASQAKRAASQDPRSQFRNLPVRSQTADRKALLLGTALASTLLLAGVVVPTPVRAQQECVVPTDVPPGLAPIDLRGTNDAIDCFNSEDRDGDATSDFIAIGLSTKGKGVQPIELENEGRLRSYNPGGAAYGIYTLTKGDGEFIEITNRGEIIVSATAKGPSDAYGIAATTLGKGAGITIDNFGDVTVSGTGKFSEAFGIDAYAFGPGADIDIDNRGEIAASTTGKGSDAIGIRTETGVNQSDIFVDNFGDITVSTEGKNADATGIYAYTYGKGSDIAIDNRGDMKVTASGDGDSDARGIEAYAYGPGADITIKNTGDFEVTATNGDDAVGIDAETDAPRGTITIDNHGDLKVRSTGDDAYGIYAYTDGGKSSITVYNSGNLDVTSTAEEANGIEAVSEEDLSRVRVENSGDIKVSGIDDTDGIDAESDGEDSPVTVINSGDIHAVSANDTGEGIDVYSDGERSEVKVTNSGDIYAQGDDSRAIDADSDEADSSVTVENSGDIKARATGSDPDDSKAYGIYTRTSGERSSITIVNKGSVFAEGGTRNVGIYAYSYYANKTMITNSGEIGAESHRAIDVKGAGTADIWNAGLITGFVDLTEQNDRFFNQSGGVFETKKTSLFGGGSDLFVNEAGGTVQAATSSTMSETSAFEGLETFRNRGLISMLDGQAGDSFRISNTPGGTDLSFEGGGQLGVDVFLDGAGSPADTFTIEGNVSGTTEVVANNTNGGPGTFNSEGIPVVFVTGATPSESNFVLANGPIDTGLFDYDLFFEPTGSGQWEFRSFVGGSAHALPKLLTAAQDMWHQTSATWFDRTADLRVVLNGGGAPGGALGYDAGSKGLVEAGPNGLTPAVWMKGGGGRLDRDSSATTSAYGRTYTYDLDNEFSTFDLQVGVDMGQYDVIAQGDVLIFGVLGGFVGGKLDYDSLGDTFDFSGGQVGAYATYLNGGLFVDTLLNVHLYEINTPNLGFPDSLNASTVGLRTDAGYRFGSFTEGLFFEPLATIEVTWADIDGFAVGGNRVSFSDDANVRGRIGGRVGTTMQAWEGTTMEPFLIASLWGNLSEDNSARLVSSGTTFNFNDDLDDVWGEISGGVNLFNFSQTTSVFAKVDYTFGEDVQGVGGKAGVRAAW